MSPTASRIPVILDVDTGVDDAMALALALRSPELELVAVTTLAGNVGVDRTTANTLAVLDHLGADTVPVHRGASRALSRPHADAAYFHGESGLGSAALPASRREVAPLRGPAAIIAYAVARPGEITLICTGPLTNLAIALNVAPELGGLLRQVIVMGGAFRVPGNVTPHAEYNIWADPEAAHHVFEAPLPGLMAIGLDVTHQTSLSREAWERAEATGRHGTPAKVVAEVNRHVFLEQGRSGSYLHDPLTVGAAIDPSLLRHDAAAVQVTRDDAELGRTRIVGEGPTLVAAEVDAERFVALFEERLGLR